VPALPAEVGSHGDEIDELRALVHQL
jgi:hypothetical protein